MILLIYLFYNFFQVKKIFIRGELDYETQTQSKKNQTKIMTSF